MMSLTTTGNPFLKILDPPLGMIQCKGNTVWCVLFGGDNTVGFQVHSHGVGFN